MKDISKIIMLLVLGIVFIPTICFSGDQGTRGISADIDNDGRQETVQWKKFTETDLGSYYQLLVIDDDGRVLWKGPKEKDESNPYVFSSLHIGVSLPQLLSDIDNDGYTELLAPELQSDVRPTHYRKLRWKGDYFEELPSYALIMESPTSDRFVWRKTSDIYTVWVSRIDSKSIYGRGLVKVNVTGYMNDNTVKTGDALVRFDREGAVVQRWINPISRPHTNKKHKKTVVKNEVIGIVYGLDPNGDGFLSIRKKPRSTEIGRLYNGDRVKILGRSGKWYKIKDLKFGRVGWSHSNWIRKY